MSGRADALYYAELQAGAAYLAGKADDAAERAEHLKMAAIYGQRASAAARGTVH